jgi:hypothetical protein
MIAIAASTNHAEEQFLAKLIDAAFEVTARHGLRGSSVDAEVQLWHALGGVVREQRRAERRGQAEKTQFVAQLTEAAYQVALDHGFMGSFVDVELDLWTALCRVVRRGRGPVVA